MKIRLLEIDLYGHQYIYQVWVDNKLYSEFNWRGYPLTYSQQHDVIDGYRQGLSW